MRSLFSYILAFCGVLVLFSGCSKNLDDIYLDDNKVMQRWDGGEIPFWLANRYYYGFWLKSGLEDSSCEVNESIRVYKFEHKELTLLALSYDIFNGNECQSGTLCYSDDGREVDFEKVKGSFRKGSTLLETNVWGEGNIPTLQDFKFSDVDGLEWLRKTIENLCRSKRFLCSVNCGYAKYKAEDLICLEYEYFEPDLEYTYYETDDSKWVKKYDYCVYKIDGERVPYFRYVLDSRSDNWISIKSGLEFFRMN